MRTAMAWSTRPAERSSRRCAPLVFAILLIAAAPLARAQAPGTLVGTVRDSDGVPIAGATIAVTGFRSVAVTDADGEFRLERIPPGRLIIEAKRIGFHPAERSILLSSGTTATVDVDLERLSPVLTAVRVEGLRTDMNPRLAGFLDRRDKGLGHFITREEIDRRGPMRTTDLIRTLPGVRVRTIDAARTVIYFRGATCPPLVYVDGAPAAAAYFDPDLIAPRTIEGIEVYPGPSTVPPQFTQSRQMGSCGVIVIWTRTELPPPRRRTTGDNARVLAELVEGHRIFTADQVDSIAVLADSIAARPSYPQRLLHERERGAVVAEFVVDTLGRVERETLGVVSASHREFADAVMIALTRAVFRPAIRHGRRVRQLVQQPFTFEPGTPP